MHLWDSCKWEHRPWPEGYPRRAGLRFRFEPQVEPEVRRSCMEFGRWLRKEFYFPVRVTIYVKAVPRIRAKDGELVVGTCWRPTRLDEEPYIRIAAGDYRELLEKRNWPKDNILACYLTVISHELTHYFQWVNGVNLTPIGEERQATRYSHWILEEYAGTREHP